MKRSLKPVGSKPSSLLPDRKSNVLPAKCDASRRRFLRNLASGAGLCLVGFPKLSHGQSISIDLTKLDGHRPVWLLQETDLDRASDFGGAPTDGQDVSGDEEGFDIDSTFGPSDDSDSEGPTLIDDGPTALPEGDNTIASIIESRALWVEPGYLLLIRWSRPEGDEAPIANLEGAADSVGEFLSNRVTNVDDLHNLDILHQVEFELVEHLAPLIRPAEIDVIHLDHDCSTVCNQIEPSLEFPEVYDVDGGPMLDWE